MASPADSQTSEALITRAQSFISDNKQAILAGAAVAVAAGGVGYYLYSTRASLAASGTSSTDVEKGEKASEGGKKKKKSSSKKKKNHDDGPILEERKPKATAAATTSDTDGKTGSRGTSHQTNSLGVLDSAPEAKLTKAEIEALPESVSLCRHWPLCSIGSN